MKGTFFVAKWQLALLCIIVLSAAASCSKEERKIDVNDGTENPVTRKLVIEVTHRYTPYDDSLLPNVAITLYQSLDDEQMDRHYRRDTTDDNGKITFGQIAAGDFRILMKHPTLGEKKLQVTVPTTAVAGYEYYYF